ncbi:S9 family peptidase [Candidatus Gracilibacteria bacterium]|nr:S9 family peptidase [Candidatus Gracilibacteria bacterium]
MLPPLDLAADALWRRRLRTPQLSYAYAAPSAPTRGIVAGNIDNDTFQMYAWDVATGALRQLSVEPYGLRYGWLTPDGERLIYLRDTKGSEIGHLVAMPFAGGAAVDLTPDLPPYTLRGFDISRDGRTLAFDAVGEGLYRHYVLDLQSANPPRLIAENSTETWEAILSYDGALLALKSSARADGRRRYSTAVLDTASGLVRGELWDGPEHSVEPVLFSPVPGDARLLVSTTIHAGFLRPALWDYRTGTREDIVLPELVGEIAPLDWSHDGAKLLLLQSHRARRQLYIYEIASGVLTKLAHPEGLVLGKGGPYHCGTAGSFFTPDDAVITVWENGATPAQLLLLDGATGAVRHTLLALPAAPSGTPLHWVEFPSGDGTLVQGWLGVPAGAAGPHPTILNMHGGPHYHVPDLFDPWAQAWLDHGFAFLTINYRGSTGFGRAFREQIEGDIGHWELEDMVAARAWLVEQGIAQPDQVFLEGGSYGGFLTTWGLARRPELWAGGMAPAPLLDWTINYEDSSDALRGFARALHGGPPDELPQLYRERSPLTYVAQIRAPLLITQGRSDSRTPPRQVERFAALMEELDKDLELVWLEGGHGFSGASEIADLIARHLSFARRVLAERTVD